ncbi:cobalamin biosynthesis protein CbiG [Methylococcaceae bacterium HT3]|nr:cobalamin biosynthesis protein CbiG [Methylococcaceae bacterium HT3]
MSSPKIVLVAITKHGANQVAQLAAKLPDADILVSEKFRELLETSKNSARFYSGPFREQIATLFQNYDQIVFFVSLGAVVRLVAPFLQSKDEDPGIIVVDDAAQFVIPVLSGHVGGANACAEMLADLLQATPVLTTASDVGKTIPVDILGRELGWQVEAPKINITRVSAHVVNEEPIAFIQEAGNKNWWTRSTALPKNIHLFEHFSDVDLSQFKAVLWVTNQDIPENLWQQLHEGLVVYRPPSVKLVLGLGCDRGTPLITVETAITQALASANLSLEQVTLLASIDKKQDEVALLQLAKKIALPMLFYPAEQLAKVPVPSPSAVVMKYVGTPSVSEAAAILAAETDMSDLLVEKYKYRGADGKNATVSIVQMRTNT